MQLDDAPIPIGKARAIRYMGRRRILTAVQVHRDRTAFPDFPGRLGYQLLGKSLATMFWIGAHRDLDAE